jgi:hypothetical protein
MTHWYEMLQAHRAEQTPAQERAEELRDDCADDEWYEGPEESGKGGE